MSVSWVLCCGEAVYDVATDDATHLRASVGGGPTYAALALARVGTRADASDQSADIQSALWTGLPRGVYGERIVDVLKESGVYTGFLTPSSSPPSLALTSPRGTSVDYELYAEGTASYDVTVSDAPESGPDGAPFRLVHLGGLGTAIAPMADVLREVVPRWAEAGTLVGYDPNIRDGFTEHGQGVADVEAWFRLSDIVKVSTEDLEALYGDAVVETCVERILSLGAHLVIVTDGPGPVSAHTRGASVSMSVDPWPEGVLPVGAGDSFIAGAYAALLESPTLPRGGDEDALRSVLRAGLASVARHARR
ncbi:MAG: PfkB family carbohydrate kinase [Leucobacter sp.]